MKQAHFISSEAMAAVAETWFFEGLPFDKLRVVPRLTLGTESPSTLLRAVRSAPLRTVSESRTTACLM